MTSDSEAGKNPHPPTHLYSTSVVLYLKQFHTPVPNGDTDGGSARIQTVFKQFFEGRSRTMYDLDKTGMAADQSERVHRTEWRTYLACGNTVDDFIL
jgi:hypothetical protein